MGLGLEFRKTNQNKNQYPRYLGLKFEKKKNSVSDTIIYAMWFYVHNV